MNITCTNLATGYGSVRVGQSIELSMHEGELICLLGPNGCGKTTLFKTILGLIPPLSGSIQFGGRALTTLDRRERAREIAYVPQQHAPPFPFEVIEMVTMGRTARIGLFAHPSRADERTALQALQALGIEKLARADYSRLSGGQRQLVLIARALAQQTPHLVMDEPTASLDFGNRLRVLRRIRDLSRRDERRSVILSTHDPDQAFALNARVVLMAAGSILADGRPEDVLTDANLSTVYGTPVVVETTPSGRKVCLPAIDGSSQSIIRAR